MKPRTKQNDGITPKEYQTLAARRDEMLSLAEEIIWQNYPNPKSDEMCPMAMPIKIKNIRHTKSRTDGFGISTIMVRSGWKNGSPWNLKYFLTM